MDDIANLDIAGAAKAITSKSLSSIELTEHMLRRIALVDPHLKAFVEVLADKARESARAADAEIGNGRHRGPLHGVPIAIKALYDVKGVRTTSCSKVRQDYVSSADSTVVRKLKEAGAVILGIVTTHEFAFGFELGADAECLECRSHPLRLQRRDWCGRRSGTLFRWNRHRYRRFDTRASGCQWNRRDQAKLRAREQGRRHRPELVTRSCRADGQDHVGSRDPARYDERGRFERSAYEKRPCPGLHQSSGR